MVNLESFCNQMEIFLTDSSHKSQTCNVVKFVSKALALFLTSQFWFKLPGLWKIFDFCAYLYFAIIIYVVLAPWLITIFKSEFF
jgi:hypothetical protein